MEIKASAKYERISPRKLRLLAKNLKGFSAGRALERLEFHPQEGSFLLIKVIKQAVANAKNNFKITNDLMIKTIQVGEGPSSKRMDKSHGARFDRGLIKKRTAHLFLTLEEKQKVLKKDGKVDLGTLRAKPEKEKVVRTERRPAFTKVSAGRSGTKS